MLALLLALQAVQGPLAQRADTAVPVHDALHYDITLILPDTGSAIVGQVETAWRIAGTEPLTIDLDSVMTVHWLRTPGRDAQVGPWRREGGRIIVPQRLKPGDTLVTRIRYTGVPRTGLVFGTDGTGGRVVFADNWPDQARGWFPSHDYPGDKATVAFHVELAVGLQVRANGQLMKVDTLKDGHAVWHYRIREPIPTYTMVVGAAHFAVTPMGQAACPLKCVPQSVWTFPADSAWAVDGPFHAVGGMVDLFSSAVRHLSVRGTGARAGRHPVRRRGERRGHLVRLQGDRPAHLCGADGRTRDRAPVVRRRRDRGRLAPPLAVGGVRHLPRRALGRAHRRRQRAGGGDATIGPGRLRVEGHRTAHPRLSGHGPDGPAQLEQLPQGQLGPAFPPRDDGRFRLLCRACGCITPGSGTGTRSPPTLPRP